MFQKDSSATILHSSPALFGPTSEKAKRKKSSCPRIPRRKSKLSSIGSTPILFTHLKTPPQKRSSAATWISTSLQINSKFSVHIPPSTKLLRRRSRNNGMDSFYYTPMLRPISCSAQLDSLAAITSVIFSVKHVLGHIFCSI